MDDATEKDWYSSIWLQLCAVPVVAVAFFGPRAYSHIAAAILLATAGAATLTHVVSRFRSGAMNSLFRGFAHEFYERDEAPVGFWVTTLSNSLMGCLAVAGAIFLIVRPS